MISAEMSFNGLMGIVRNALKQTNSLAEEVPPLILDLLGENAIYTNPFDIVTNDEGNVVSCKFFKFYEEGGSLLCDPLISESKNNGRHFTHISRKDKSIFEQLEFVLQKIPAGTKFSLTCGK